MPTRHRFCRFSRQPFLGMQVPGCVVRRAGTALLICALLATPASAHKVSLFAWVDNATVHTESKFSGGRTPKDSAVIVYDLSGNKLIEGSTDDQGRFSFPAPAAAGIRIVLAAGQGHQAEWTVSAEELAGTATPAPSSAIPTASVNENSAGNHADRRLDHPAHPSAGELTAAAIQEAVVVPLQQELQQLRNEVRRLRSELDAGPSVTDILGAIGYIIGLVGLGAYFKYRPRASEGSRHDR